MSIKDFKIFADENVLQGVVEYLRELGFDVKWVCELGLQGKKDIELMPIAFLENRIILTQDSDFGTLAFTQMTAFSGIIYLRPGHFPASLHIASINALIEQNPELIVPFMIVLVHSGETIKIRIRNSL